MIQVSKKLVYPSCPPLSCLLLSPVFWHPGLELHFVGLSLDSPSDSVQRSWIRWCCALSFWVALEKLEVYDHDTISCLIVMTSVAVIALTRTDLYLFCLVQSESDGRLSFVNRTDLVRLNKHEHVQGVTNRSQLGLLLPSIDNPTWSASWIWSNRFGVRKLNYTQWLDIKIIIMFYELAIKRQFNN